MGNKRFILGCHEKGYRVIKFMELIGLWEFGDRKNIYFPNITWKLVAGSWKPINCRSTLPLGNMSDELKTFRDAIQAGIPEKLPTYAGRKTTIQHAPVRSISSLSIEERRLALANALRYF